jgi:hypothetical protein
MLVTYYPDIATLAAIIAHSQIVVPRPPRYRYVECFPAGYEEIDIAILDWIVADGARVGRGLALM